METIQYSFKYFMTFYNMFFVIVAIVVSLPIKEYLLKKIKNKNVIDIMSGICGLTVFIISIMYLINSSYSPSLYAQF